MCSAEAPRSYCGLAPDVFCATFYSYKGGVGRTLALANVAAHLAQKGRRILVVDLDLEAPGLTTLPPFREAAGRPGMVDFVTSYLSSGSVPEASDFIHRCEVVQETGFDSQLGAGRSFNIDVMPAGVDDEGYADRLYRIDWNQLYAERQGFLLMENLRAAWQEAGYDYVLIDSRTGHTDVGGICTRQLPDAVVAVFFPNEQNLVGLRRIVEGVRTGGGRPQPIELLFTASRVPRLDDEHGHLGRWLERFQQELGYGDDRLEVVEHYDSLMLLNQALFVLDRPRSGLAEQYRNVAASLARLNVEDPDGALDYLAQFADARAPARLAALDRGEIDPSGRLDRIQRHHFGDSVVQFALARAYYRIRSLPKAAEACDLAITGGGATGTDGKVPSTLLASAHRLRLKILTELGRHEEAVQDARAILDQPEASSTMLVDAVLALAGADPAALVEPLRFRAIESASARTLLQLADRLAALPPMRNIAADIAERAVTKAADEAESRPFDPSEVQLVLIAAGRFQSAIRAVEAHGGPADIQTVFNTAIAHWGLDGRPDHAHFHEAARLFDQGLGTPEEANWQQCRALTCAVLGDLVRMDAAAERAVQLIRGLRRREFSCWTYRYETQVEFERQVAAIVSYGKREGPPPDVVAGSAHNHPL